MMTGACLPDGRLMNAKPAAGAPSIWAQCTVTVIMHLAIGYRLRISVIQEDLTLSSCTWPLAADTQNFSDTGGSDAIFHLAR
jgi:hypothetical protein